jgi:mannosyltransferase
MRIDRTKIALLFGPALLALSTRLYGLADKPLWLDEVITQKRANLPLPELITNSLHNVHFPTYFILVRAFDAPIVDEWMLRLPSVIFGTIAVLLVAFIASEARTPRAGLVAGTLMALSPVEVQFSQEARSYALLSCLVLLALWGLVRITKYSTAEVAESRPGAVRAGWIAYAVGTVAALNVLLVSAFWLLAANLAMVVIVRRAANRTQLIRNWLVMQAVILIVWLPGLAAILLATHEHPLRGYSWIPPSTWQHVWSVVSAVYLFRISDLTSFALFPAPVPGLGAAVVALALFGAWWLRREPKLLAVIGFAFLIMPAGMLVMSVFHPVWVPRYLLWSTGPLFVLAGIGAAALPRPGFALAAAAVAIGGIVNLAPYYRAETKPRWDLAAAYLAAHARPDDSIVANDGFAKYILGAYGDRYRLEKPILDGGNVARAAARIAPPGRVWVVFGRVGQAMRVSEGAYLKQWSALLGAPAATVRFDRNVVAFRFDPPHGARDGAS